MAKNQVVCLGELLVDFTSLDAGKPLWEVEQFHKNIGGAPANVAIGLHHHGCNVHLWTRVGSDSFGKFLIERVRQLGMDTAGIQLDRRHPTKLAFVGLNDAGDRYFEFHNARNSAEQFMQLPDFPLKQLEHTRIFHFGGVALLGDTTFQTTLQVLESAKNAGCEISFDPNIRIDLMKDPTLILNRFAKVLKFVDILKLSEEDLQQFFAGQKPADIPESGIGLLIFTEGAKGAQFISATQRVRVSPEKVSPEKVSPEKKATRVVDTTGAGDAFIAAFLAKYAATHHACTTREISAGQLEDWGNFANHWAARVISYRGAVTAYFQP